MEQAVIRDRADIQHRAATVDFLDTVLLAPAGLADFPQRADSAVGAAQVVELVDSAGIQAQERADLAGTQQQALGRAVTAGTRQQAGSAVIPDRV